jgi:hypothetical protein
MDRARFQVRDLESQLLELDRMIIALDRRFAPLASGRCQQPPPQKVVARGESG